jgi:hypothetical protein
MSKISCYGSVEINIFVIFGLGQSNDSFLTARTGSKILSASGINRSRRIPWPDRKPDSQKRINQSQDN